MVSKGTAVYVAAFVLLLTWAFFVQADTRRVDGHSMLPTLEGGDLLVIQNVPISQVHVGDIIVYNSLCSTEGLSVVHRVVDVTSSGLITKGDNNKQNDIMSNIASGPITQQCLEGKVVFVIPYVEQLAFYIDQNGLPQWLNYIPSILILIVVIASIMTEGEDEKQKTGSGGQRSWWTPWIVLVADVALLLTWYLVLLDMQGRAACLQSAASACIGDKGYASSFSYSVFTQTFAMTGNGVSLTSPLTLAWVQVLAVILVATNMWFTYAVLKRRRAVKAARPAIQPSTTEE